MPLTDNTIDFAPEIPGTYYVRLRDDIARKTWKNTATVGWQTYDAANWTTYAVVLAAETDPLHYSVTVPAGITTTIERMTIEVYLQSGASPATSDYRVTSIEKAWNGSAFVSQVGFSQVDLAAINNDTGLLQSLVTLLDATEGQTPITDLASILKVVQSHRTK